MNRSQNTQIGTGKAIETKAATAVEVIAALEGSTVAAAAATVAAEGQAVQGPLYRPQQ
jgi:hypothetical protein